MTLWNDDAELFDLARRELFSAVVGDVLDVMGLLHQFLPIQIRPLAPDMVVIGRAMPVLVADFFAAPLPRSDAGAPSENDEGGVGMASGAHPAMRQAFGLMFQALDDLKPNEVYVCNGASRQYALWGELMSLRATKLGAAGAVLDGPARDTKGILALNFPTFSRGVFAQDQHLRGKVVDYRTTVEIGGVLIQPGDILFGDIDGVLVIPKEAETEAFTRALEKSRGEQKVRQALEAGMSSVEAFAKFGIM